MRVVASLTTMPDRYSKVLKTLESINNQTYKLDAIYLGIPKVSRRLGIEYPPIPYELNRLCTVVDCVDYGPITKILGGLVRESDRNTVIITFDDDMIYPNNMVEMLIKHHNEYPNSAIGSSGMLLKYPCPMCAIHPNENNFIYRISKFNIPCEGRRVDSIYGYPGALYVRKFFPDSHLLEEHFFNYALIDDSMYMNDDIVISGFLSLSNIERRIFCDLPDVSFVLNENGIRLRNDNEISYNMDKFFQRMNNAIAKSKSVGMYEHTEPLDPTETLIGYGSIIVISILVLIFIIYYILFYQNI